MSAKPKFAVVLSGCGVYDGSEIHEAVLTLLTITAMGGRHRNRGHGEVCVDTANKVVTTPCYMLNATIGQIADGAAAAVAALLELR